MASSGGQTPASPQRSVPAGADSTKAAQHKLPVSGAGPLTMTKRTAVPVVTGPSAWENGRDKVSTPSGPVVTATVGLNPDPPANRQAAPDISPTVPYMGGSPTGYDPYTGGAC